MSVPDTEESLINSLSRLCAINPNGARNVNETENTPQYDENFQNKVSTILEAVKKSEKYVDPKIKATREKLPIFKKKEELIRALEDNQVLIVIGETGSGKTTQLPQYLKEIGLAIKGHIGCTQLRRMAAKAVARRVAREQGCKVGEEVGFTIRFEDITGPSTQIQYMTDGILLRECTYDRLLTSYSAIILDESHERTVDTDILLGVLRWILTQRNDLKLIISSATLEAEKFSSYFFNAKVFRISGRMYPVEIIYRPSELSYTWAASKEVIRINEREEPGDILVFMSGEGDIEELSELLEDYRSSLYPELIILPCYSALPWEEQSKIFEPAETGKRKVIIATNIAETSLTVDGIRYVVDSGWVKQKKYDPRQDMEVLKKVKVSRAQAIQRSGRAGRLAPGKCYRLYHEYDFETKFVSSPEPEIKRSSLTSAILLLKKMGFNNLSQFQFIDEPPADLVQEAEDELKFFAAANANGEITELGKKMSSFPLEPNLAKMLVISEELSCSEEILTIVALLSVPNIFFRPKKRQKQADAAKAKFFTNDGDLLTMLKVYNTWLAFDKSNYWCKENFINGRQLHEAFRIREQLCDSMKAKNMKIRSAASNTNLILKSICSGLVQNVAQKNLAVRHSYVTLPKLSQVFIHPGSALFRVAPEWVVYQKVVQTSKAYMREVTPVSTAWIKEFTPAYAILQPTFSL